MEHKRRRIGDDPWKLSFKLIQEITSCFSEERKLGSGAFGQVYKGVLEDGEEIAVKMLHPMLQINNQQFQNEFETLKRFNHENIVRLLGFCDESEEVLQPHEGKLLPYVKIHRALCLEYVPNGNLGKLISGELKNWPVWYRIIKGICEGLKYLHEGLEVPVLHLDLTPQNILLDQDMVPKIADFGISRLIGEENTVRTMNLIGTFGFINNGIISKEYDIFSLGVVVAKIITGTDYSSIADMEAHKIIEHAYNNWRTCLQAISNYASIEADCRQVRRCIQIAVNCMDKDRRKRPTIKDIVSELDEIEISSSLQPQCLGTVHDVSNIHQMHTQEQNNLHVQQPHHSQEHMASQFHCQPNEMQQLLKIMNASMLQKVLTYARMLVDENSSDPQMQYLHAPSDLQEATSSTSLNFTVPTSLLKEHDMQEELYAMIKSLKETYFTDLNEMYNRASMKLEALESLGESPIEEEKLKDFSYRERLKGFKLMLERCLNLLQINKEKILPSFREKIPLFERQIISIIKTKRPRTQGQQMAARTQGQQFQ